MEEHIEEKMEPWVGNAPTCEFLLPVYKTGALLVGHHGFY